MITNISYMTFPWLTPIGPISEILKVQLAPKNYYQWARERMRKERRPSVSGLGVHVDLLV